MAFNFSAVSPGDDILAAHINNLFLDLKAAHHQEAGATQIVNADVDAAAAIAYSKLNLALGIVNADINAAAAIAWSKISKSGSNLTDLSTAQHAALSAVLGSGSYHLSATEQANVSAFHAEAAAFWAATDITGAEAQTLTGGRGSDASSLHSHEEIDTLFLRTFKSDGSFDTGSFGAGSSFPCVQLGDGVGTGYTPYLKVPTGKQISSIHAVLMSDDTDAGNIGYNLLTSYMASGEDGQIDGNTDRTFSHPSVDTLTKVAMNSADYALLAAGDYFTLKFSRIATGDTSATTVYLLGFEIVLTNA